MNHLTERVTPLRTWLYLSRKRVIVLSSLFGAFLLLLFVAHLVLNGDGMKLYVRDKARAKLEQRLGPIALGSDVFVSWFGEARVGPLAVPGGPGEPPLLSVDQVAVRASILSLLRGNVEPSKVTLSGITVRVDEKGERLRAYDARRPHSKSQNKSADHEQGAAPPTVIINGARVVIDRADPERLPLQVGPVDAQVKLGRDAKARSVEAWIWAGKGSAYIQGALDGDGFHLDVKADDLPLHDLLPSGSAVEVRGGLLSGKFELEAKPGADEVDAQVDAQIAELVIQSPRIAAVPVGPAMGAFTGTVKLDRAQAQLTTTDAKLVLGAPRVEIPFEASVELRPELAFDVDARVGPVQLQTLAAALPPQLAPPQGESRDADANGSGRLLMAPPHVDGTLRAELRASGPVRHPDEWSVGVRLDTKDLKEKARAEDFALRDAFTYKPRDVNGVEHSVLVSEKSPDFVPLNELPAIVPAAVITSEDGNFFSHNGFDFEEIRDSIATAAEGQRLRGGSTLTQQLVKNLYLSRERTLSRKLREALLTLELEAALPKQRILEIYLNIIEWGPGIYGINQAAHYYFGVDARRLTPKQAVFLATIIPNPIKFGVYFRKGATSKNWDEHMAHLIDKLRERGDLDEAAYQKALNDPVVFRAH
ncbi:MAG: transglycosylase domain-containing protein [Deltaproteobacteria bacterium]|nr:transglycosylase domain-containing protein [Deltaproteobacteria bacterium]